MSALDRQPLDYPERIRTVRPAPPHIIAAAEADDEALNRTRVEPSIPWIELAVCWIVAAAIGAMLAIGEAF